MGSTASRIAVACVLAYGLVFWPGRGSPDDDPRRERAFGEAGGQEVVGGSYSCNGTVYTDDQPASVGANAFLSATSGIADGFWGTGQSSFDVPADLDAMEAVCETHLARVLPEIPAICALGPVERERGEFGNGASVVARFDFSCQGTRNEVIDVIGGFGRLALTERLPRVRAGAVPGRSDGPTVQGAPRPDEAGGP